MNRTLPIILSITVILTVSACSAPAAQPLPKGEPCATMGETHARYAPQLHRAAPATVAGHWVKDSPNCIGTTGNPQIVEFYGEWCTYCQQSRPNIFALEARTWGEVDFLYMNDAVGHNQGTFRHYGIRVLPTFMIVDASGDVLGYVEGANMRALENWIDSLQ